MKASTFIKRAFSAAIPLAVAAAAVAAPRDELEAAIRKLAEAPNYSWSSTTAAPSVVRGDASIPWVIGGGDIRGMTTRGGYTFISDERSERFIKDGEVVASRFRSDFRGNAYFNSIVSARTNWVTTPESVPQSRGGSSMRGGQRTNRPAPSGERAQELDLIKQLQFPAAEAQALLGAVSELGLRGGALYGAFSAEAVLISNGSGGSGARFLPGYRVVKRSEGMSTHPKAEGDVRFWIKDGVLVKYEYRLRTPAPRRIEETTVVEIKDLGTTRVVVPEELRAKLEQG